MTTDPIPHRAVLTVTAVSRPDGGHYLNQADFAAHVAQWVKTDLKDHHAIAEVTVSDQPAAPVAVPPTDRAAVLAEAIAAVEGMRGYPVLVTPEEAVDVLRRLAAETPGPETQGEADEWCKCRSCWGWFVEEHPGEDLDELGRDLGWWSGLPEHRDAPAGVSQPEIVHSCPPDGSGLTPCCGRTPFELPLGDRISSEALVTCTTAPAVTLPGKEA